MTNFIGTEGSDNANAAIGELSGFTNLEGGDVPELQDGNGDFFARGGGEDSVFAGNASDRIEGGEAHDVLNGGEGNDTIWGNTEPDPGGSLIGDEIVGNIGDDSLFGSSGGDVMEGGDDEDTLQGLAGNDLMQGGRGADRLSGGEGDDVIYSNAVGGGSDSGGILDGGAGADTLIGGNGGDLFIFRSGDVQSGEVIDGGTGSFDDISVDGEITFVGASISGIEQLFYSSAVAGVSSATFTANQIKTGMSADLTIDKGKGAGTSTLGIEMRLETFLNASSFVFDAWSVADRVDIAGDADGETIIGTSQIDRIFGNGGNDLLIGASGIDEMTGGSGNDIYFVDAQGEAIEGANQGTDTVRSDVSYTLGANFERLELLGGGSNSGAGNELANIITGNSGANALDGAAGNDQLIGSGGLDQLRGGLGNDLYTVNAAGEAIEDADQGIDTVRSSISYTLGAHLERLQLLGAANRTGIGNGLDNRLTGNDGANALDGLDGKDTLTGNAGADRFKFTTALGGDNVDRITDFAAGIDEIRIDNPVFTGLPAGALAAGRFRIGPAAADASDRIIYNDATGALFFDADGVGGAAKIRFATLDSGLPLTAGDFFVI